ncbi:hypothetical protein [Moorena sp. SIO4G3]|uniref:hypothetical protein n=1 Tax=Moorena sp. SIO4G3 TaxID=2607821 RepID=UPI00142B2C3D|nr:hypothetical protein [Moorena sp. SIO4G3]NEO79894.1 hypothetical protein [Moorena sp. SIO4G3]
MANLILNAESAPKVLGNREQGTGKIEKILCTSLGYKPLYHYIFITTLGEEGKGCISLKLFDLVVRYGQQPNQGLEAENEGRLTHPTQHFQLIFVTQPIGNTDNF